MVTAGITNRKNQAQKSGQGRVAKDELKVRLNGVPSARIFHRAGYYELGAENALERVLSNAEVVVNDLPQNEIGVAAMATPFPTRGNFMAINSFTATVLTVPWKAPKAWPSSRNGRSSAGPTSTLCAD